MKSALLDTDFLSMFSVKQINDVIPLTFFNSKSVLPSPITYAPFFNSKELTARILPSLKLKRELSFTPLIKPLLLNVNSFA